MTMRRNPPFMSLVYALALGAGLALCGVNTASADDEDEGSASGPCTTTKFAVPAVEKACKDGGPTGRKKASDFMRATMTKAKDKGLKVKDAKIRCKSCHVDTKEKYELKENAVEDLKRLLAAIEPPPPPKPKAK